MRVEEEQEKSKDQRSAPRTPSNKWKKPSRDASPSNPGKGTQENPKVYADPKHNIEAAQLGLFESGTG